MQLNERTLLVNDAPVRPDGAFVLYWMTANRRISWNHGLDRAVAWARELAKPLVVLEALRADYHWAGDRLHQFVLEGMAQNQAGLERGRATYYPYVEHARGAGKGLLAALGEHACVVVTDDFPAFFYDRMLAAAGRQVRVRLEKVDSSTVVPFRAAAEAFKTAHQFRRYLHGQLLHYLDRHPSPRPLAGRPLPTLERLPTAVTRRWRPATAEALRTPARLIAKLPIDHDVAAVERRGGPDAARGVLRKFVAERLGQYADRRNEPEAQATSGLSPYLHFGHIGVFQVVRRVLESASWRPDLTSPEATGRRTGWWGASANVESFLDELITWRELGFNTAVRLPNYHEFGSLPQWSLETLETHAGDPREFIYSLEEFEAARTHDELWNAAQRQLRVEGTIHGYLRMLWGKKILEWTPSPQIALDIMVELNNRYALDGRDPNSYSGIFWVLGRYDRPWGPRRPVFGTIRYMSSQNTARKFNVDSYIERYSSR